MSVCDPACEAQEPRRARRGSGKASDDAQWLEYADRVGRGFVDWQPFDHPQLGRVEIGGFVPGFKMNPPQEAIDGIIDAQAEFIEDLLEMLPRVRIAPAMVERVGPGVWRVGIEVHNDGQMSTRTAMGEKSRRLTPYVLALDVPQDRLVGGSIIERVNSIAPGGVMRAEWLVLGDEGETITAQLRTEELGTTDIEIELAETAAGGNDS